MTCDLKDKLLCGSDLTGCDLTDCDLTACDFTDCDFTDCDFTDCDLDLDSPTNSDNFLRGGPGKSC
ncbi:pentapeptide repeat-containing protein [archaeon]|nr:pentapeptide repeat-containing protein [archaeon]